jgi:hypothetical protein
MTRAASAAPRRPRAKRRPLAKTGRKADDPKLTNTCPYTLSIEERVKTNNPAATEGLSRKHFVPIARSAQPDQNQFIFVSSYRLTLPQIHCRLP